MLIGGHLSWAIGGGIVGAAIGVGIVNILLPGFGITVAPWVADVGGAIGSAIGTSLGAYYGDGESTSSSLVDGTVAGGLYYWWTTGYITKVLKAGIAFCHFSPGEFYEYLEMMAKASILKNIINH